MRGFTLVELMVVLALMVMAAFAVLPSFVRFQQQSQLQDAARRTLVIAAEARELAVARDTEVMLIYDAGAHGLRLRIAPVEPDPDTPPTAPEETPASERRTGDLRLLDYPLDVALNIEGNAGSDGALLFHPDGRSAPATVRLEREGFEPVTLAVNPATGRLHPVEVKP